MKLESAPPFPAPEPLSAARLVRALRRASISHVVTVPDTYQKTFLDAVAGTGDLRLVFACTEDEAIGINAGLYVTGHRPLLSIQNNGLFACLNTLRGIALDGAVPTIMLIGQYGYRGDAPMAEHPKRAVHMLEPTLRCWGVPVRCLWSGADIDEVPAVYAQAQEDRGPAALVIPVPTVE